MSHHKLVPTFLTGSIAIGLTLLLWMLIVMSLDRRVGGDGGLLWACSLWLSTFICVGLISCSKFAVRPVLGCSIAFGVFGLAYFLCEGPIFGVVSEGGDPTTTNMVFWNLVYLPLGAFVASEIGSILGSGRRRKRSKRRTSSG